MDEHKEPHPEHTTPYLDLSFTRSASDMARAGLVLAVLAVMLLIGLGFHYRTTLQELRQPDAEVLARLDAAQQQVTEQATNMRERLTEQADAMEQQLSRRAEEFRDRLDAVEDKLAQLAHIEGVIDMRLQRGAMGELAQRARILATQVDDPETRRKLNSLAALFDELQSELQGPARAQ